MSENPYTPPLRIEGSIAKRKANYATVFLVIAIVFLIAFAVMFFLSTRFYWQGRVPELEAKDWIWYWLPKSVLCWLVAIGAAMIAVLIERNRKTIVVTAICASPLLFPIWILISRLFFW